MPYRKIVVICVLLINCTLFARAYDCIVITSQCDTLTGKFISADPTLTIHHVVSNRRLMFEPQQVQEFAILLHDGTQDVYQFITDTKTNHFRPMRRLIDGDVKLFEYKVKWVNSVNNGLPKGSSVTPTGSAFYISMYGEAATEVTSQNWKNILTERLKDCPALVQNLGRRGYKFQNLTGIIAAYNVCNQRELTSNPVK